MPLDPGVRRGNNVTGGAYPLRCAALGGSAGTASGGSTGAAGVHGLRRRGHPYACPRDRPLRRRYGARWRALDEDGRREVDLGGGAGALFIGRRAAQPDPQSVPDGQPADHEKAHVARALGGDLAPDCSRMLAMRRSPSFIPRPESDTHSSTPPSPPRAAETQTGVVGGE